MVIPPEMRALYHATCVVASNHLTALLSVLEHMFERLIPGTRHGEYFRVFKPILQATMKNVERTSPAEALSGPVARGGVETVEGHLAAIRRYRPDLLSFFASMTEETLRLATEKGSVGERQVSAMRALLASYHSAIVHPQEQA